MLSIQGAGEMEKMRAASKELPTTSSEAAAEMEKMRAASKELPNASSEQTMLSKELFEELNQLKRDKDKLTAQLAVSTEAMKQVMLSIEVAAEMTASTKELLEQLNQLKREKDELTEQLAVQSTQAGDGQNPPVAEVKRSSLHDACLCCWNMITPHWRSTQKSLYAFAKVRPSPLARESRVRRSRALSVGKRIVLH
eukprot:1151163-Amphidinium_carterae.1